MMRTPGSPRPSWAIGAGLALVLAGCATSSSTKTPTLPQPPQPPSPSSVPSSSSPSATKPEAKGGTPGESGAKPGEKGQTGAKSPAKAEAGEKGEKPGDGQAASGGAPGAKDGGRSATGGGQSGTGTVPGAGTAAGGAAPGGGATTPEEQRGALDGQLQASMTEFDRMLLKEQQALEEKQRKEPLPERGAGAGGSGGQGEGGSGGGSGKQGGGKPGDDRTPAERRADAEAAASQEKAGQEKAGEEGRPGGAPADTGTGASTDAGRLEGGTPVTAPVEGGPAGPGPTDPPVPRDVGDGKDDDVVARQLREAAMKEKDPAIREKLWDEYREYKKGAGR